MSQSRENAEATSFAEAMENLDLKTPQQGELLRGTIVSISGDDAYISYGGPSEAVMDASELEVSTSATTSKRRWSRPAGRCASRAN